MGGPLVKLVTGVLFPSGSAEWLHWAKEKLVETWGPVERESGAFPFDWTDYYHEIAPDLSRVFWSFAGLCGASELRLWKRQAIGVEGASGAQRRVNIDPGYVDGARLVLASTKDHAHRIWLGEGIFAELTLCYRKKGWQSFYYTFPDFKSDRYHPFLSQVREDWKREIKEAKANAI